MQTQRCRTFGLRKMLAFALGVAVITASLAINTAAPVDAQTSSDTPDWTCDPAHEGWLWDDGVVEWECQCNWEGTNYLICVWVPIGVFIADVSQEYNGSYGRTWVTTAFDSNPDYLAATTHSRNSNGSTRTQGTGELRTKVIGQKWTGSSWSNCVDSGYSYSWGSYSEWKRSYNMYTYADCGAGTYRVKSYGYMYDSGWRGGIDYTATCYRD